MRQDVRNQSFRRDDRETAKGWCCPRVRRPQVQPATRLLDDVPAFNVGSIGWCGHCHARPAQCDAHPDPACICGGRVIGMWLGENASDRL